MHSSTGNNPQPGLKDNPGKTQAVFSDDHPYFPSDCKHCAFYNPTIKARLQNIFRAQTKDCYHCPYIDGCINEVGEQQKQFMEERRAEYQRLLNDPDYKNVRFSEKTGGVKATHIRHNKHQNDKTLFFGNMTGDELENECVDTIFHLGHSVILREENTTRGIINGQLQAKRELDCILDGKIADIASITKDRDSYHYTLLHKNRQLKDFNVEHDTQADSLILYFHDPRMYSEERIRKSIEILPTLRLWEKDELGNSYLTDELVTVYIKHIICVTKDGLWREYDIK